MRHLIFSFTLILITATAAARETRNLDLDWRFQRGDPQAAMLPNFNDSAWRSVTLPHDWSIEGPFSADFAAGTGYAPGGIAWYRRHFRLSPEDREKNVTITFDGVYDNSEVWINGAFLGRRPYGYSSFHYDLTPYLHADDDNVIAVRVDHSRYADSRWYTGSGITRDVTLTLTDPVHVAPWGVCIFTTKVTPNSATVKITTQIANDGEKPADFRLENRIITPDGKALGKSLTNVRLTSGSVFPAIQYMSVANPVRWSPDSPALYTLATRVYAGERLLDEIRTPFGIRTIHFDANRGFFLNGNAMKIKGVCLHHDAGSLGAAVPAEVWERRLRLLKSIGVNAIRTSHNPPDPALLDLCDRLGFLVMDEAFDEFSQPKRKWVSGWNNGEPSHFGYAEFFRDWAVRDLETMIRRDRNHPSIIMWSIGNEVDYANDPFSHPSLGGDFHPDAPRAEQLVRDARPLIETVHRLDSTRPVTAALATIKMSNAIGLPELLDIVGYNYQEGQYSADHATYPKRVIFGSENGDAYDAWRAVADNAYISGQFLWTGIDYLGEAGRFPNRANGAGLVDLIGFKKPEAWWRQALWSEKPMVYGATEAPRAFGGRRGFRPRLTESWTGQTGTTVTLQCYTNCDAVRLTLNGRTVATRPASEARAGILRCPVTFEPGTLTIEGLVAGEVKCQWQLKTPGPAARISLTPDEPALRAGGRDLLRVVYQIEDAAGTRLPRASNEVTFKIDGPADIVGIGNADLNNTEPVAGPSHAAYEGRGVIYLRSLAGQTGTVRLAAIADGLESASLSIPVRESDETLILE